MSSRSYFDEELASDSQRLLSHESHLALDDEKVERVEKKVNSLHRKKANRN